jgi:radical SAM superfamily enzyme YgiQ (UPF0313 family)
MRVLLVHAAFPVTYWGFQYSLPIIGKRGALPPLGLVSLAALLPPSWELRLVDVNVRELTDGDLLWADAVLVGGMLVQSPSIHDVVDRARRLGRRTVVGGPAATTSPALFPRADHVFVGEAEGRIGHLVAAVERPGSEPHRLGELDSPRPDLASVPVPRFDLLDPSAYRSMSVQYSRGCPYSCEFCDIVEVFGRVPRVKSTTQVLAELDALYRLGHRGQVFFVDDNFIGNKRAVRTLLPELARWQRARGWPFSLYTEASVNLAADPALLRAMVGAGFESVFLGLETPSPEALRAANKKQNVGVDLAAAVDTITRAGLAVMGGFIVGFDTDDASAFDLQRRFIESAPIPLAMVGLLTALPGTALWRRLALEDRLAEGATGDQFGRPNFRTRMGDAALLEGYASLMQRLYSTEGYFSRVMLLVDRIGTGAPGALGGKVSRDDAVVAVRAIVRLGILGERRRWFWRTLARAVKRGPVAIRAAIAHSVMGEHMIRYTAEHVLPRLRDAIAETHAEARAIAREPRATARPRRLTVLPANAS